MVDGQAAVGVAVEGEPDVGAVLEHGRADGVEVGGAAAVVDVEAVGRGVDRDHLGAGVLQGARPDVVRRTLGAVEHDGETRERVVDRPHQVRGVLVHGGRVDGHAADVGTGRAVELLDQTALDGDLDGVVELEAAAGEELDAVVGHRVVRGGQHDAEVGSEGLGEVGDARGRQHAEQQDVDARGREAGDHRGLQELPGDAGVAAHHGQRAVPLELAEVGEHVGGGDGQVQGQAGGEVTVGQAADAVRAEQASHWAAARGQRLLY